MLCLPALAEPSPADESPKGKPSPPFVTAQKNESSDASKEANKTGATGHAPDSAQPGSSDETAAPATPPPVIKLDDLKDGASTPSPKTSQSNQAQAQSLHPLVEGVFLTIFLLLALASLGLGIYGWREGSKIGFATFAGLSLVIAAIAFVVKKPVADLIAPTSGAKSVAKNVNSEPETPWATMTSDAFGISALMLQPVTVKRTDVTGTGSVSVTHSEPGGTMTFSYGRTEEALKTKKEREEQGLSSTVDVDARAKKVVDEIHGTVISKKRLN